MKILKVLSRRLWRAVNEAMDGSPLHGACTRQTLNFSSCCCCKYAAIHLVPHFVTPSEPLRPSLPDLPSDPLDGTRVRLPYGAMWALAVICQMVPCFPLHQKGALSGQWLITHHDIQVPTDIPGV